LAIDEDILDL